MDSRKAPKRTLASTFEATTFDHEHTAMVFPLDAPPPIYLHVERGPGLGRVVEVPAHPLLIGRSEGADLQLQDSSVSRHHAELRYEQGRLTVRDLHSQNGTFLEGKRVREEVEVRLGQVLSIGKVNLRVRAERHNGAPSPSRRTIALVSLLATLGIIGIAIARWPSRPLASAPEKPVQAQSERVVPQRPTSEPRRAATATEPPVRSEPRRASPPAEPPVRTEARRALPEEAPQTSAAPPEVRSPGRKSSKQSTEPRRRRAALQVRAASSVPDIPP